PAAGSRQTTQRHGGLSEGCPPDRRFLSFYLRSTRLGQRRAPRACSNLAISTRSGQQDPDKTAAMASARTPAVRAAYCKVKGPIASRRLRGELFRVADRYRHAVVLEERALKVVTRQPQRPFCLRLVAGIRHLRLPSPR